MRPHPHAATHANLFWWKNSIVRVMMYKSDEPAVIVYTCGYISNSQEASLGRYE